MTRAAPWLILAMTIGCGKALWHAPPAPTRLQPGDYRESYVGDWQIQFALDSTRDVVAGAGTWTPAADTMARVTGSLEVQDSLLGDERVMAATYTIDFVPLLGRQISCLRAASGLQVEEEDDHVSLWFTPGAFDCGFSGTALAGKDTLSGTWEETSFVGDVARGRFWMWRR